MYRPSLNDSGPIEAGPGFAEAARRQTSTQRHPRISAEKGFGGSSLWMLDMSILTAAFALASIYVYQDISDVPLDEFLSIRVELRNIVIFIGLLTIWYGILGSMNLYSRRAWPARIGKDALALLRSTVLVSLVTAAVGLLFRVDVFTPGFVIVFWLASYSVLVTLRLIRRQVFFKFHRMGDRSRRILIVGSNDRALALAEKIATRPELGYKVEGFVDDTWLNDRQLQAMGYTKVASIQGFHSYITHNVVDEVFICTPIKSFYEQSAAIVSQCEEQGITVHFIPDVFNPTIGRACLKRFDDDYLVTVNTGSMEGSSLVIKRLLDFWLSLLMLTALLPVTITIAVLIKLDSPGPVLFGQQRLGLNKRKFRFYKFRTMHENAETMMEALEHLNEAQGPVFKIRNDPRITRIGAMLRRTSLDELPQLINVIKGDMSLVGPRPLPLRDCQGFSESRHRRRFSVKPGITCLWQIQGRSNISFEKWMELDMHYIDNWSLWLDIKIMLKTVPAVLKGTGAY